MAHTPFVPSVRQWRDANGARFHRDPQPRSETRSQPSDCWKKAPLHWVGGGGVQRRSRPAMWPGVWPCRVTRWSWESLACAVCTVADTSKKRPRGRLTPACRKRPAHRKRADNRQLTRSHEACRGNLYRPSLSSTSGVDGGGSGCRPGGRGGRFVPST